MPLVSAVEIWVAMMALSAVTLGTGILAGRSTHAVSRTIFLICEAIPLGALFVLWMFEVWFVAKTFMAVGLGATVALVVATVCGIGLVVLAGYAGAQVLRWGYMATGLGKRFGPDLRNSLWISKGTGWRPSDFSSSRPR